MRDRSTYRRQVWISLPLALTLFLGRTDQASAQVAPKESSSRLIHRFPPLPDIVQRKAEIDAKRSRTGILTKMLTPNPSASRSIIEIDLDLAFKKKNQPDQLVTPEVKASIESKQEPSAESASTKGNDIVPTSHQQPASVEDESQGDDSDPTDHEMPPLPEVEPASQPTLPASTAPTLRSADDTEENSDVDPETTTQVEQGELPPPAAAGSMRAPSTRRDRRRLEGSRPIKPTPPEPSTSLPRTLPEMDAPPIREALTKEQADAAQRELEKKLLSVTQQPELTLPEMPTLEAPSTPAKVVDASIPKLPPPPASDDLTDARNELHRLAKPIPVEDPSLELAAEELKQLAESEELQDAAAAPSSPASAKPGLKFARDEVRTKGVSAPAPIQPVSNQTATQSKPTLDAPPAINLPPVSFDSPQVPEKKTATARTQTKKEEKEINPLPAPTKNKKSSASEPLLKPIPPAASVKPTETVKPVVLSANPPSDTSGGAPMVEQKPKSNVPRLRREPDPSALSSTAPTSVTQETKTTASTKSPALAQPEQPTTLHLPQVQETSSKLAPNPSPTIRPKTVAQKSNVPPSSWRPVMPTRNEPASKSDEPTIELIQTRAESATPVSSVNSAPSQAPEPKTLTPDEPAKPRILAPIEADELGTTSTRSILMPAGEKLTRVDFSRSLAARAVDTLVTSRARTARERALADLHRMDLWFKAEGSLEAVKQVALADDRLLMRQAAVEVLAATPTNEKQIDRVLADIAASNSEGSIRQQAREAISQRNRQG